MAFSGFCFFLLVLGFGHSVFLCCVRAMVLSLLSKHFLFSFLVWNMTVWRKNISHLQISGKRGGLYFGLFKVMDMFAVFTSRPLFHVYYRAHAIRSAYVHVMKVCCILFVYIACNHVLASVAWNLLYPVSWEIRDTCARIHTWEMHNLSAEFLSKQDRWWCIAGTIQRTYGHVSDA